MQVLVFGSNAQGFHGAGSAGLAFKNDARNNWREHGQFLKAMKSPIGSPDRIGFRAVFGIARGFQTGTHGSSYAIQTVTRPGEKRSIPLSEIKSQIQELITFANEHPDYNFGVTNIGEGYAGYSREEMNFSIWNTLELPTNIIRIHKNNIVW